MTVKSGTPDRYILIIWFAMISAFLLRFNVVIGASFGNSRNGNRRAYWLYSDRYISGVSQYQGNTALWLLFLLVIVYAVITYLRLAP